MVIQNDLVLISDNVIINLIISVIKHNTHTLIIENIANLIDKMFSN